MAPRAAVPPSYKIASRRRVGGLHLQSPHMRVAGGGPMMLAHIGIMRALNRLVPEAPSCVHDLAGRLICQKCKKEGKRLATLLQLTPRSREPPPELNAN
jgi:hypothetical protein